MILKKAKYFLWFFLLVVAPTTIHAQKYELTLYSGECWYQPAGRTKWEKLTKMQKVEVNQVSKIKIANNTQVFVEETNKAFLMNKAGIWQIEQWLKKDKLPSIGGQYLAFLLKELTHKHKSIDEYAEGYLKQKGLVSRGNACAVILSPENESLIDSSVIVFRWLALPNIKSYSVVLYKDLDNDTTPFFEKEINDTNFHANLNELQIEKGLTFYWSVNVKNNLNCNRHAFKIPQTEELKQFEQKNKEFSEKLKFNDAMNTFLKAGFYEQHNFYKAANQYFKKATEIEPQNQLYRESYALFLARHGYLIEAKKLSK